MFEPWWSLAETHYVGLRDGKLGDTLTLYYDPILRYDHRRGPESALMMAVYLAPQKPEVAELIFAAAAARLGWTTDAPLREPRGNPRFTLWGLILAREFGEDAIYDKLAAHCETHHEPTWDAATGEFTWGFGLNEPHPRGQFNATRMMAEALSEGAWRRLFNVPHLPQVQKSLRCTASISRPSASPKPATTLAAAASLSPPTPACPTPVASRRPSASPTSTPLRAKSKSMGGHPTTGASLRATWRLPPPSRSTSSWSPMRPVALRKSGVIRHSNSDASHALVTRSGSM